MFCLVAGGGIRGGQVLGETNSRGEYPVRRPVSVGDLHATIYQVLGIPDHLSFTDFSGRPIAILPEGKVISELF